MPEGNVYIIGAGPAGMGCAHVLTREGQPCTVIEQGEAVGGLCRTLDFDGYLFDIGGHRFLSKSDIVNRLWHEVMAHDMLSVKRLSRIFYRKRYFNYPLTFFNTFWNLGFFESVRSVLSYFYCKSRRPEDDNTFEGWIINRFGRRLYDIFFKVYTEKIWSVPCKDISADWAQQRIRGLSLRVAIQDSLLHSKANRPKTLSSEFLYPRTGPGEFYRRFQESITAGEGRFTLGKRIVGIRHNKDKVVSVMVEDAAPGRRIEDLPVDYLFSSMPLPVLIETMRPSPPEQVVFAARRLTFRSLLVVNIILDKENVFQDQWIYLHSPEVKLGRIQNYKNWSPAMVLDTKKTSLGLEYFCTEGDEVWNMNDVDLINHALDELETIGIVSRRHLINGFVVRRSHVYPVYSRDYKNDVAIIKRYLSRLKNFQTMGRAGLFHYDNSDHALLTGIYAAKNFFDPGSCDVWAVNTDMNYLES